MISFVIFSNLHYFNLWRILSRKKGGAALIPTLAVYNCTAAPTVIIATNCYWNKSDSPKPCPSFNQVFVVQYVRDYFRRTPRFTLRKLENASGLRTCTKFCGELKTECAGCLVVSHGVHASRRTPWKWKTRWRSLSQCQVNCVKWTSDVTNPAERRPTLPRLCLEKVTVTSRRSAMWRPYRMFRGKSSRSSPRCSVSSPILPSRWISVRPDGRSRPRASDERFDWTRMNNCND